MPPRPISPSSSYLPNAGGGVPWAGGADASSAASGARVASGSPSAPPAGASCSSASRQSRRPANSGGQPGHGGGLPMHKAYVCLSLTAALALGAAAGLQLLYAQSAPPLRARSVSDGDTDPSLTLRARTDAEGGHAAGVAKIDV